MKYRMGVVVIWALSLGTMLLSCVGTAPTQEAAEVDSLNQVSYASRYRDLTVSEQSATQAYQKALLYHSGRAEACNNLGFCAFMRMDYEKAWQYHQQAYDCTGNELELLIADIGLMRICQRRAKNKEFYDYRNSALRRMKRIAEDDLLFANRHERRRLTYARSEFAIISAVYYYYLQQRKEALDCINTIDDNQLVADTSQLLYYHYIKGATALGETETSAGRTLAEFDELYFTWRLASRLGYCYFEGNSLQGLANLMDMPADHAFIKDRRPHELTHLGEPSDSLLPLSLGQRALKLFKSYGDAYQIAGTYVSIARYLNMHGQYSAALDTLDQALKCMENKQIAPECILRIHEQLSVTYAGLGMKEESDYNRNIYLDILDDTRQDRELESRYAALAKESKQLNGILFLVLIVLPVVGILCFLFNKWAKKRSRRHLWAIREMLDICQQITASIPLGAQGEEDIINAIQLTVGDRLKRLLKTDHVRIEGHTLVVDDRLGRDEQAMAKVIAPYVQWTLENGMAAISLGEEREKMEQLRYIHEQHIADNKRKNLVKKACLSIVYGINPYIDRIINEVYKLTEKGFLEHKTIKREKFQYIEELVTTINEYNDILALWVKLKQGELSLNIETFALGDLFTLILKGNHAFEMKQQNLRVVPTDAYVKADRALTLFMINTLAENARKYTQRGGTIRIYATPSDDYVEISVEDNGRGLSPVDVERIIGEKVYDSNAIGMEQCDDPEELRRNKGQGFGLMNCKGIIEKYRKTNDIFRVCLFSVESTLGHGSRFFFRLPKGVKKVLMLMALCCSLGSCYGGAGKADEVSVDTLQVWEQEGYEQLLDSASDYANAAYYCNVEGAYDWALVYIDSAMQCLNAHYARYAADPRNFMIMVGGEEEPAELEWWNEPFYSDFHVILDIRNEAAVAFLALKQWQAYVYNNSVYTTLYKLLGEDHSLEEYCQELARSTTNKRVGLWLLAIFVLALLLGYYVLYWRKRRIDRFNLEQVLEINHRVFMASLPSASLGDPDLSESSGEEALNQVPKHIISKAFDAINDLLPIDSLCLVVCAENSQGLHGFCVPDFNASSQQGPVSPEEMMATRCFREQVYSAESDMQAFPLLVEVGETHRCIGALCLRRREGTLHAGDDLFLGLVARYVAIVMFNAVVKLADKYRDIEIARDEARRALWEDSQLHVQNQVLDNCLSTIKHETVYYPHRIKLLISKLRSSTSTPREERESIDTIGELIAYYKGVFGILSRCAARQLQDVTFRRTVIDVADLMKTATKYFNKAVRKCSNDVKLQVQPFAASVVGDDILLRFLFENLIDEALTVSKDGELYLNAHVEDDFVQFGFTDTRRHLPQVQLNQLFYPNLSRLVIDERGRLRGTEYLLCKQIIREHDEYAGRRGCRINACVEPTGGYTVYFTLPRYSE